MNTQERTVTERAPRTDAIYISRDAVSWRMTIIRNPAYSVLVKYRRCFVQKKSEDLQIVVTINHSVFVYVSAENLIV